MEPNRPAMRLFHDRDRDTIALRAWPLGEPESRDFAWYRARPSTFLGKLLHGGRTAHARNETVGPRVKVWAGPGLLGSLCPDPEPAITAGAGSGAPRLARDSRNGAVSVRTGGSKRGPGTD